MVEPSEQEPTSKSTEENKTTANSYDAVTIQLAFQGQFVPPPFLLGMDIEDKSEPKSAGNKKKKAIRKALEATPSPGGVEKVIPDGEDIFDSDDLSDKEEPIGEEVNAKRSKY